MGAYALSPALFSHCVRPNISIVVAVSSGLHLQPRLTGVASSQLALVSRLIASSTPLGSGSGRRFIDSPSRPPFSSKAAYRMLSPTNPDDSSASTAWGSCLPAKLKIFTYLADIDRLSTRANLFAKNCAPSERCVACPAVETGRHLFFDCELARSVWAGLGVSIPDGPFSIWNLSPPPDVAPSAWRVGVAALLWNLWKARNNQVFNGVLTTRSVITLRACDDIATWRWRFRVDDRPMLDSLRSLLLSPTM
jgi:hypothetical protein